MTDNASPAREPDGTVPRERLLDIVTGVAGLALFLMLLYPGVGGVGTPGDAAKFQYVGSVLGVPHSPAFPLYVMLNAGWVRVTGWIGLARSANMFSAVLAASALVLLRRALRALGAPAGIALAATATLALSPAVLRIGTQAGPQALGLVLCAALLLSTAVWVRTRRRDARVWMLVVAWVAAGHDTVFLWLLPVWLLLATVLEARIWAQKLTWLANIAGVVLGFGVYVYVVIRAHQAPPLLEYVPAQAGMADVVRTALGGQFWPNWFFVPLEEVVSRRLPGALRHVATQLHYVGGVLALVGLACACRVADRAAWFVYALTLVSLVAVVHMFAPRIELQYWLFTCAAGVLAGIGAAALYRWRRTVGMAAGAALLVTSAVHAAPYARERARARNAFDIENLLLALPQRAVIITDDTYTWQEVIRYFEHVNPFVARRSVRLSEEVQLRSSLRNFFFNEDVRAQIDDVGIPYTPILTNGAYVLYVIGVPLSEPEE